MGIQIDVRNAATGETRQFNDLQEVSNFLNTEEFPGDWVGFESFGQLPEPHSAPVVETPVEQTPAAPAAKKAGKKA